MRTSKKKSRPARENPPASIRIRRARVGDGLALAALDERCFPAADRFSRRIWRHLLGSAARNHSAITVVAERDGQLIGAANVLLRRGSRVIRLYTLAVDPAARGLGLANRLVASVLALGPARCDLVSLEVRAANPARGLYERWGMQVTADLPGYYHDGAAGVRMQASREHVTAACQP